MGITLDIPDDVIERIARRAADLVAESRPPDDVSPAVGRKRRHRGSGAIGSGSTT